MKCFPVVGLAVDLPPCQLHLIGRLKVLFYHYDDSIWSFIKEKVAQQRYTNTYELKQAVTDDFNEVTPQMLSRMSDRLGVKSTYVVPMMRHKRIR